MQDALIILDGSVANLQASNARIRSEKKKKLEGNGDIQIYQRKLTKQPVTASKLREPSF